MRSILQDFQYAFKTLRRTRGVSLGLILVIATGIAGTTAMFTVIYGVILRPLPFKDPNRLVVLTGAATPPGGDALTWWSQSQAFTALSIYQSGGINLSEGDAPRRVPCAIVSASYFSVFETQPSIGQPFITDNEKPGNNLVAILSNNLWVQGFGSDPNIIGRNVTLNSVTYTIIGVMPPNFSYPGHTDIWIPRAIGKGGLLDLGGDNQIDMPLLLADEVMIGRLRTDVNLTQAKSSLDAIFARLQEVSAKSRISPGDGVRVIPLQEILVRDFRHTLLALLVAVGFLLLIACANAANLLLLRATTRRKEIAIRLSLGATRMCIVRQLLIESILVSIIGGLIGTLLAYWGVEIIRTLGPRNVPRLSEVRVDVAILAFSVCISLLVGVFVGIIPSLQASKSNLAEILKEVSVSPSRRWHYARKVIAVIELALALVLIVGAWLTSESFLRVRNVAPGFDPSNTITMKIFLPAAKYRTQTQQSEFQQRLVEKIEYLPEVLAAGIVTHLPLSKTDTRHIWIEMSGDRGSETLKFDVAGNYFHAMGINLLKGRSFNFSDKENTIKVIIINKTLAHLYWNEQDPIGQFLNLAGESTPRQIIAVVEDTKTVELAKEIEPQIYLPYSQPYRARQLSRNIILIVRTNGDPNIINQLRNQIASLDKDLPIFQISTLEEVISNSISDFKFRRVLTTSFASLALILAMIGVYGVMSYKVTTRTMEIGIRAALGATPRDIVLMIIREGALLAIVGLIIGIVASFVLTRFISSLLYGIGPTDPVTLTWAALLLIAGTLLACLIPALRASNVDPAKILKYG